MKFSRRSLRSSIHRFLKSNPDYLQLKKDEQSFLLISLTEFVARGATKFIAGGIKHADSDFFTETNFDNEINFEIIDNWMYHKGREYKKLMKDKMATNTNTNKKKK
jgi:hypothetical protein